MTRNQGLDQTAGWQAFQGTLAVLLQQVVKFHSGNAMQANESYMAVILCVLLTSCAAGNTGLVMPGEYLSVKGFSLLAPRSNNWMIMKRTETEILLSKPTSKGTYHTVRAGIRIIHDQLFKDIDALNTFAQTALTHEKPGINIIESNTYVYEKSGMQCIFYEVAGEDYHVPTARGKIFKISAQGTFCAHPDSPQSYVAWVDYSQRFFETEEPFPPTESMLFISGVAPVTLH